MDSDIVNYASLKKMIITEGALRFLNTYNYKKVIDKLENKKITFIKANDIKEIINSSKETKDTEVNEKRFHIIEKYDVTGKTYSQGKVTDFLSLFLDKYKTLSHIIKDRLNFNFITIKEAQTYIKNKPVDIIGMLYEKRITKNGNLLLIVDDPTSKINLVVLKDKKDLFDDAKQLLLDNVIGFKCNVISSGLFIVNEIIYPDVPLKNNRPKLKNDTYLAIISDTHIGSKLFLEKEFAYFIEWLGGKTDEDNDIIKKIKYIVIAGDLVDGIGIYPKQFEELAITNIYKQYELFEDYILKIPKDIEIFIAPGNHDAVRLSDPQPAIPEIFLPRLYKQKNIHMIGSPSWVVIEGFKCIIYHGAALQGIYSQIPSINMTMPDLAMKEVLKRRDLMPQYGQRQTFVPMDKNLMTINEVPDIFIGGDVHCHAYSKYKNIHLINSSCWQSTTSYQIEKGHTPTLCKLLLFNLKTEKLIIKDFYEGKNEQ